MKRIAQFEKISFEEFLKACDFNENEDGVISKELFKEIYDKIKLPQRSTNGSAGYDFFMPFDCDIAFGESVIIPTGIKCCISDDWYLGLYPRSGQGFKFGIHIANTVGIIDSDYYNNENNEGHIMVKITNDSSINQDKPFCVKQGQAFCQGIFMQYGITIDDEQNAKSIRSGGFGSTDTDQVDNVTWDKDNPYSPAD